MTSQPLIGADSATLADDREGHLAAGPVVLFRRDGGKRPGGHEIATKAALAKGVARLTGRPYGGEFLDGETYLCPPFFIPDDTLTAAEAARLGITGHGHLFGGVVPSAFVATKAITHRLADAGATAPQGWQPSFGERVADVVLPGATAFARADALQAGDVLLKSGALRLKRPDGVGGAARR